MIAASRRLTWFGAMMARVPGCGQVLVAFDLEAEERLEQEHADVLDALLAPGRHDEGHGDEVGETEEQEQRAEARRPATAAAATARLAAVMKAAESTLQAAMMRARSVSGAHS